MDKFEKIIDVPSCLITKETSNKIAQILYTAASEQANADLAQAMNQIAAQLNLNEQGVTQLLNDENFRNQFGFRKDKTIFISPHKNVEYGGRNVTYEDIPTDVEKVIISVPGAQVQGRLISVEVTNDLIKGYPLHNVNKMLIQGYDEAWVSSRYIEMNNYFENSKKIFLNFIYKFFKLFAFLVFICISFLEIKLLHVIKPEFTLNTPLTGLTSVMTFIFLLFNYYVAFSLGARMLQYLYPYIEFENRLSQKKKECRWLIIPAISAIYGGGVWAILSMLFQN